ncbi:hypothetical protein YC2023_052878 [Brassica napus]
MAAKFGCNEPAKLLLARGAFIKFPSQTKPNHIAFLKKKNFKFAILIFHIYSPDVLERSNMIDARKSIAVFCKASSRSIRVSGRGKLNRIRFGFLRFSALVFESFIVFTNFLVS